MKVVKLDSSNVAEIARKGDKLIVGFQSGTVYKYDGAAHHYAELVSENKRKKKGQKASVGSLFYHSVRQGPYKYECMGTGEIREFYPSTFRRVLKFLGLTN